MVEAKPLILVAVKVIMNDVFEISLKRLVVAAELLVATTISGTRAAQADTTSTVGALFVGRGFHTEEAVAGFYGAGDRMKYWGTNRGLNMNPAEAERHRELIAAN